MCFARASLALTALSLGIGFTTVSAINTILRWHSQWTNPSLLTTSNSQQTDRCGSLGCKI